MFHMTDKVGKKWCTLAGLFCVMLLVVMPVAINAQAESQSINEVSHRYGYTLDAFCADLSTWNSEKDIEWADALMDGWLYVDINISTPYPYQIGSMDWNRLETSSPATFQLYLQSLGMVKFLCRAALMTSETPYLDLAGAFIKSWEGYLHNEELSSGNAKVWYDHGSALRAENLIYYLLACEEIGYRDEEIEQVIQDLLVEHAEFLTNPVRYTKNHNHGIYQDEALLYIAYFLPQNEQTEAWKQIAHERLTEQMAHAFTSEGVHVENSASYCIGVIKLLQNIEGFLLNTGDEFAQYLGSRIHGMWAFYARLVMPTGMVATVGDSFRQTESKITGGSEELNYVESLGETGAPPSSLSAYYPESGYFFTNESYNKEGIQDSTWLMFKAGYVSSTHKHADDLQILLCSKGHEVFIDPGMYNYMSGNMYRDYLVSASAHNTVIVDGQTYSVTTENSEKTGLLTYENRDDYQYVLGYNDMYTGVQIDRHVYSFNDAVVVFDDIESEEPHTYSQLFQLSEDMKIVSSSEEETVLSMADTDYLVRIRQYGQIDEARVIRGGTGNEFFGYASDFLNEIHEINTLKYDQSGTNAQFVTLITIEDEQGRVKLTNDDAEDQVMIQSSECSFDPEGMSVILGAGGGNICSLKSRERVKLSAANARVEEKELTVEMPELGQGAAYQWYVIEQKTKRAIYKSGWVDGNIFSWQLTDEPILIKVYMKDQFGKRRDAIVGQWMPEEQTYIADYNRLNYVHFRDSMEKIDEDTYRFTAGMEYALDYTIRWYVYKDGSYYTVQNTRNENVIDFEFTENGSYTVSYYIDGYNGEREYWVFPAVVITKTDP